MIAMVAFDLDDADAEDYERAYEILAEIGLDPITYHGGVELPTTTVMGPLRGGVTAVELRDWVQKRFKQAGLELRAIFGGVLHDWGCG